MNNDKFSFLRDERVLKVAVQIFVVLLVIVLVLIFGYNLIRNFQNLGLSFGFDFLKRPASFGIGDAAISYQPNDSYSRAILVGIVNSLRVIIVGIVLATLVGIITGIARLSDNWLIQKIATIYIEVFRNTPLLLQLFFWYFAVFLRLPTAENTINFLNLFNLSNLGLSLPWPSNKIALIILLLLIIFSVYLWQKRTQAVMEQDSSSKVLSWILLTIATSIILILIFGLNWQIPQFNPTTLSFVGGLTLSPELATLVMGLTFYTAAFIAEVIRCGIISVNKGQWEAAKALGLKPYLVMQLIIFPQALRVIIPPLTSEFLNLAKNSSLAIAIGYNDVYGIANTVANQTGRSIEMLLIVMSSYLIFNLIISSLMNLFNNLVQIKER
ncbi:amino acid ABC transporter permease [Chroococcus sp. FPU101]|uniref:amino acid ABC transporter permease n=1 Tax=Chroococcus sp. FPU101 TaxID=1974212 RepID=UPI001A8E31EF|nr:ABC transporter permease subunit [Chroococcus sp. FPU101]GFE69284.1 polar amino acid ABC transporter, inner membrane subunit [Chroococcus sp. FPU101]